MVFENITLFELHLENSRFSASRDEESGWTTESEDYEAEEYAPVIEGPVANTKLLRSAAMASAMRSIASVMVGTISSASRTAT